MNVTCFGSISMRLLEERRGGEAGSVTRQEKLAVARYAAVGASFAEVTRGARTFSFLERVAIYTLARAATSSTVTNGVAFGVDDFPKTPWTSRVWRNAATTAIAIWIGFAPAARSKLAPVCDNLQTTACACSSASLGAKYAHRDIP